MLLRFAARRQPRRHFARSRAAAVNAGLQPFGDEAVALAARGGHVARIEGRPPVGRPIDAVGAVAVGAGGGHQQPRLVQAVAVRGLHVGVQFLLVAPPAGLHLVVDEHRRTAVVDRQDVVLVCPVTLAAVQQRAAALLVLRPGLGVDALDQFQPLVLVADGAHLPRRFARAAEAVLLGVRFVDLRGLVVAAVAVVAVDALLPVDVFGQCLAGDVQPLGDGVLRIRIADGTGCRGCRRAGRASRSSAARPATVAAGSPAWPPGFRRVAFGRFRGVLADADRRQNQQRQDGQKRSHAYSFRGNRPRPLELTLYRTSGVPCVPCSMAGDTDVPGKHLVDRVPGNLLFVRRSASSC